MHLQMAAIGYSPIEESGKKYRKAALSEPTHRDGVPLIGLRCQACDQKVGSSYLRVGREM